MAEYISISKSVALWLITLSKRLVDAGLGTDWDPAGRELPELEPGGLLDLVNLEEHELFDWTNALVNLARTVAGILTQLLQDDAENDIPRILIFDPEDEI
jgi:hypothetical protein